MSDDGDCLGNHARNIPWQNINFGQGVSRYTTIAGVSLGVPFEGDSVNVHVAETWSMTSAPGSQEDRELAAVRHGLEALDKMRADYIAEARKRGYEIG